MNNQVKTLLGGLTFTEGVEKLSEENIILLANRENIRTKNIKLSKIKRALKAKWSLCDLDVRKRMIDVLKNIDINISVEETTEKKRQKKDEIVEQFHDFIYTFRLNELETNRLNQIINSTQAKDIDQIFIEKSINRIRCDIFLEKEFKKYAIKLDKENITFMKIYENIILQENIKYLVTFTKNKFQVKEEIEDKNFDLEKILEIEHQSVISSFQYSYNDVIEHLFGEYKEYEISFEEIENLLKEYFLESIQIDNTLKVSNSVKKRIKKELNKKILLKKQQKNKEELLARTIRDFKNLFPIARNMNRKLKLIVGETNSGKTYDAMKSLIKAETGFYLAPLRLLALEGYDTLRENKIPATLITGEEELVDEDSFHISSTIEMLNFNIDVDVCVIDEVQMLNDKDRGWAWTNAIIGVAAKEVIMTGSLDCVEAIKSIANWLGEELEIVYKTRLSKLKVLHKTVNYHNLPKNSAIICFSRKDVLNLKSKLSNQYRVSIIYGNLSPEVRREEARRFREGKTDILISTDAIAMGLNLPIKTIVFAKTSKFDGETRRFLHSHEIKQICGRAGRFGIFDTGYITAIKSEDLHIIQEKFNQEHEIIKPPFKVMASLEHIELISKIFDSEKLSFLLDFFSKNMEFDGPFIANTIENMIEASKIVDKYDLTLRQKYYLSCAPITLKSPYIIKRFHTYIKALENDTSIAFHCELNRFKHIKNEYDLLMAEDIIKDITLYSWLSFKFDNFNEVQKAKEYRYKLNSYIGNSLKF
jgi:ATP-dependent RNA helicase SUPV3L1/SUV3